MAFTIRWNLRRWNFQLLQLCVSSTRFISKTHPLVCALLVITNLLSLFIHQSGREIKASIYPHPNTHKTRKASFTMSRNSPYVIAGRSMPTTRKSKVHVDGSGSSYHNDENRYVDDQLVDLVETLEGKRNSVIRLMNDAEEKQFKDQSVKKWLVNIKHALYDANALLDKIDTEKRFREKYKEDGSHDEGFVQWATSEINRIIKKLKELKEEAGDMGLKARDEGAAASAQQTRSPNDRVTGPVVGKSTIVYGREEEKAQILKKVLYAAPGIKPEVIAIVGMGGIGKTTLAQYVYNHADVERCFTRSRSWACVSDNFDLIRVTRAILESLTKSPIGVCELASLQLQLEEQLTGKRFLVVLDDAWDFSKQNWEKLMAPFSTGAAGSKIILTTRDRRVAGVVPADHSFQLKSMSEDEAWSLFSCEVFRDGELSQHPKLEAIGKEIVKKCGGSPLAIKTLSGLLRSERKEVEWERVRASSLWQLPECQKDIIPALGLSYSYLPSHLKTCFAYCSLFPKDYRFSKRELVNMWIDEGFLQQLNDNRSIEDVGVASFEDLSSRSFFTLVFKYKGDEEYEEMYVMRDLNEEYVMHDLIHDLAQMVFADFHLQLNGHKAVKECKKVRHVSFHDIRMRRGSSSKFEGLNQAESLQTFIMVANQPEAIFGWGLWWGPDDRLDDRILEDVLFQQLSLRVLCLRGAGIRTLPDTISNLKLLRCLDVSYTDVEELPSSLCKLYNLRRLLCEGCDQIKEFHYDMAAFVSLRHFTLSGSQLQKAHCNLSQLSQVEVKLEFHLPNSVGDRSDSSGSRDMKEGSLDAAIVDGVSRIRLSDSGDEQEGEVDVALDQAESDSNHTESGLHVIVNIDRSTFGIRFQHHGKDALIARDLLESLRPHRDVKEVRMENYYGESNKVTLAEFPGWLGDRSYHNIERVELVDCWIRSGSMPALGGLPSLKHLVLEGVRNVKKLGSELYNSTFGSLLEELYFEDMEEWEEWEPSDDAAAGGGICFFPRLQKLSLRNCPKLKGRLPSNLPSLQELVIVSCSSLVELNGCHRHRQVVVLEIAECGPRLANSCLVDMRLGMFPHLQRLWIGDCDSFESFPTLPTSLTYLYIWGFTRLKKLDIFWLRSLTNLERLGIDDCPLLESLGYSSDVDDCSSDDEFPFNSSIRELDVSQCVNLKIINGAWLRSLTSLETLMLVRNHPDLKERCKRDTGADWPNIAHVPVILIW